MTIAEPHISSIRLPSLKIVLYSVPVLAGAWATLISTLYARSYLFEDKFGFPFPWLVITYHRGICLQCIGCACFSTGQITGNWMFLLLNMVLYTILAYVPVLIYTRARLPPACP